MVGTHEQKKYFLPQVDFGHTLCHSNRKQTPTLLSEERPYYPGLFLLQTMKLQQSGFNIK